MNSSKLITIAAVFLLISCKKEVSDEPANSAVNNQGLDCTTCPSTYHPFDDLIMEYTETCDNLSNPIAYPTEFFITEGIVGYTQDESQTITLQEGGFLQINALGEENGFYGANHLVFDFDGTEQTATFMLYGFEGSFHEMGFEVNGSSAVYYSEAFPYIDNGIIVDIDLTVPDFGAWDAIEVTFSGKIESITQILYESGITELCVAKLNTPTPPIIDKNQSIYFDDFYNYDGTALGNHPTAKTPLGYYGFWPTNMVIKFDEFLAYSPTKIGFVHAYGEGGSNVINIQLPNTPLIVTIPDSLNDYLEPYGYSVEHYYQTGINLWTDESSDPLTGQVLDSIIIKGNNINEVTLGANLQKTELRSVCTYYEQ